MQRHSVRQLVAGFVLGTCVMASLQAQEPATPSMTAPTVGSTAKWKQFDYTCEGGAKLTVFLSNETVKILFQNHRYLMRQVIAASGTRYSDGKVVWWSKGETGFLQHDTPEGNGEMIVRDCQLNQPLHSAAARNLITGTVTYLVRLALPPDAIIQVQLEDVSRADAPATTIVADKILLGQRQLPIPFELKFDAAKIDAHHAYVVSARILVNDQLRFINDRTYPVFTQGNPSHVEIILKPAEPTPR
jgi:uncharacterized lipoprotein YbaY